LSTASHESPSAIAPGGKRDGPKVLRKVPDLPLTFLGGSSVGVGGDGGVGDSLDRIGRSMTSVTGHMSRCGGVTGGARCSTSCRALGFTGRSVSGECGFSDLGNCHYGSSRRIETRSRFSKELEAVSRVPTCHTHPRTPCFDGCLSTNPSRESGLGPILKGTRQSFREFPVLLAQSAAQSANALWSALSRLMSSLGLLEPSAALQSPTAGLDHSLAQSRRDAERVLLHSIPQR